MENIPASADQALTTGADPYRVIHEVADGSGGWRQIEDFPGSENTFSLERDPLYQGPLDKKVPEEVAFMLHEALRYFNLDGARRPQVPFDNGWGTRELKPDSQASDMFFYCSTMLVEMAAGKPRALHASWDEMRGVLKDFQKDAIDRYAKDHEPEMTMMSPWQPERDGFVYFIGGTDTGDIKIGFSANPSDRRKALQTSSPVRLEILATLPGKIAVEGAYHKRFADHRLTGEWFERCPAILAEIRRLNAGARA